MCEFRKIILQQTGYVAQCPFCQSIEIAYGTSVIHIDFLNWMSFSKYLSSVRHNCHSSENKNLKNIMLHLGGDGPLQMFLTANELQEFCNLVDRAESEMQAQNLIKMFNG